MRLRHRALARAMARSKISQNRWAQKMGITSGHLSQLANGRRPYPNAETRRRLLEGLDVGFDELFFVEAIPRPRHPEQRRQQNELVRIPVSGKGDGMLSSLWRDARFALRLVSRNPGFSAVATLALALGIGANTAIFSVLEATALRRLPFAEPNRIVSFWQSGSWSRAEFHRLKDSSRAYEGLAALSGKEFTLTGSDQPMLLSGVEATADLFGVLGVQLQLGRSFVVEEEAPGSSQVAVLSDGLWRQLGADPAIVGATLNLNEVAHEVIGVAPPGFYFPSPDVDVWVPLVMDPAARNYRGAHYLDLVGRLGSDVTIEEANAEIPSLATVMREEFKYPPQWDRFAGPVRLQPLQQHLAGDVRPILTLLMLAVGLVLLIACANVANLSLANVLSRRNELALRTALGAGRMQVVRQILVESLVIAASGGVCGLLLAVVGVRLLTTQLPVEFGSFPPVELNWHVLVFALGISVTGGVLAGLVPALRATRGNFPASLGKSRRSRGPLARRTTGGLVVAEVALAVVLVVGAGLTLKSFWRISQVDPGFDVDQLLTFSLLASSATYSSAAERTAFYERVTEAVEALPGVEAVGGIHMLPIGSSGWNTPIAIEGRTETLEELPRSVLYRRLVGSYFRTMQIPLLEGRRLTATDSQSSEQVCLINQRMASIFWPGESAVGHRIKSGPDGPVWMRIVGIVGDVRSNGLGRAAEPAMYRPYSQSAGSMRFSMVVRSPLSIASIMPGVRESIWNIDPNVPVFAERSMQQVIDRSLGQPRLVTLLLSLFGIVALVLGAVGIYGVISYRVSQSLYELGVRLALGAQRHEVRSLVLRRGLTLAAAGLVVGISVSVASTRLLSEFLFETSATDVATFSVVAATVVLVAFVACYLPARRASRLDPLTTIRRG